MVAIKWFSCAGKEVPLVRVIAGLGCPLPLVQLTPLLPARLPPAGKGVPLVRVIAGLWCPLPLLELMVGTSNQEKL